MQNRFHIEHGFLSYAKVAFLKVIAKFILPFFCIVHELDILYINRRHHYNKKEKMELFFCIVFDLHYLCRRKSGTRQSESTFIALVCIFFASKNKIIGMRKLLLSVLLALSATMAVAQESQTGYNFLRLPASAHAAALGGDNITLIEDDEALIFHNPALLSSVSDKTISLGYMNYMSGVNAASAAFNRIVKDKASWAVSAQYVDYGKMKQVDENNVQMGEFSAKDIAVAGYFSYMLGKNFVGGITAKFITSYIGDYNSIGMGVDLGINYYDPDHEWSISAVAKNLGGQLKAYDEEYDKMPIDLQMGVSKQFPNMPFRLSLTLVNLNNWDVNFKEHLVGGVEILLSNIWIGAGYNFRRASEMKIQSSNDSSSSHGAGLSLGAGLNLERFHLNLAYGKYHVSSNSLLVNLAYSL